jgi:FKBP-type peptidyl-prolyl cis-trans isomerase FklB
MNLQDKLRAAQQQKIEAEKEKGKAFLSQNKSTPGVKELENGIQYQIIKDGNGAKPSLNNTIKAHYKGSLLDGKEFDSSYRRNQPFSAKPTQLIKGWQDVIPMMPVGSIWRLWIPSDLAYGDRGAGTIPPGATLVFEIELLEIVN